MSLQIPNDVQENELEKKFAPDEYRAKFIGFEPYMGEEWANGAPTGKQIVKIKYSFQMESGDIVVKRANTKRTHPKSNGYKISMALNGGKPVDKDILEDSDSWTDFLASKTGTEVRIELGYSEGGNFGLLSVKHKKGGGAPAAKEPSVTTQQLASGEYKTKPVSPPAQTTDFDDDQVPF